MSSRKRSLPADEGYTDTEEEVQVESASSSFRHSAPKRSRIAIAHANGGSVISDDEDDIGGRLSSGAAYGRRREETVDEDEVRSFTFDVSQDEEESDGEDELRATQMIERQLRQHKQNIASECGIIEEVFCRNFMCHSKLRIRLGPLINFIVGHNGSGKSAVLTALTICLGESARQTNRGASLKGMIKHGEDSATLQVKIKNRGDGAFKPELYGRSIIVERHFTRNGTSGFKIRNADEKIITTKKDDLVQILDFFGLQLDNPINVLTQDLARQFLSNSTPKDKYKFFIRGTQLEVLDQDYHVFEENLDNIEAKLPAAQESLRDLYEKFKEAEKRKKRVEQVDSLHEKVRSYTWQHAWAQVQEQEEILERLDRDLEAAQNRVREREEAAQAVSGTFDGHDQAYEAAQRAAEVLKQQLVPVEESRAAEKEKFQAAKAEVLKIGSELGSIREELRAAKKTVKETEKRLQEEHDRIAGAEGAEHAARLAKLEELQAAAESVKRQLNEHMSHEAGLVQAREGAYQSYESCKPAVERSKDEVAKAERMLVGLQRSQGRPFDGYPNNIEQLVRAVNVETRWRHKPVGPMGRHIHLLDPTWSSQLERTFGGALNSFVVTNGDDQRLLKSVMRRVRCDLPIYIGSSEPLDTTDKMPEDRNVKTILDVLRIDEELVRNQVIINQGVEQTVLFDDFESARKFMFDGPRPRNVRAAICHAKERGAGIRLEFSRSGQSKTTPIARWEGSARMQTDRESQIREQQEVVNHQKRNLQALEQDQREKQNALNRAGQEINRWKRELSNLKAAFQRAEESIENQRMEIENNQPQDGRLQELERQLDAAKAEQDLHGKSYQDAVLQKDSLDERAKEAKTAFDAADQRYNDAKARVEQAVERVTRLANERHGALLAKNEALQQVDAAKEVQTTLEGQRERQKIRVEEFDAAASSISRRVPIDEGMTPERLDRELKKLKDDIQNRERVAGGTKEQLVQQWKDAKNIYEDKKQEVEILEKHKKNLTTTLAYRRHRWLKFRQHISQRARLTFKYLLSERNFRGRIEVDHSDKYLDIAVEPDLAKSSDTGRDARTLSGGEKSFSTICLLLSIWEAMGSPIRCLDEFDVFMDSVNRAASMKMMIAAARRSVGRQFILITPQNMDHVNWGDDVAIHRMSDPERGQGVLPFTRE